MKKITSSQVSTAILFFSLLLAWPRAEAMASVGYGGIVSSFATDPKDPNTVYAGTFVGGVFKSTNGGGNWLGFNVGLISLYDRAVTSLALDPNDSNTIFAASGSE